MTFHSRLAQSEFSNSTNVYRKSTGYQELGDGGDHTLSFPSETESLLGIQAERHPDCDMQ